MQINFDKQMQEIINTLVKESKKPSLLLHACCAPCSSACIERLKEVFDITIYFYNPNMDSLDEYSLRANEQVKLCKLMGVNCVVIEYNDNEFYSQVKGLENEREGGRRCLKCFELRLNSTAKFAKQNGFDFFTTTLTVSPLKNSQVLNEIGYSCEKELGVKFLPSDFKKKNGYSRSIELSKEYDLYRQNYCGCVFSKARIT